MEDRTSMKGRSLWLRYAGGIPLFTLAAALSLLRVPAAPFAVLLLAAAFLIFTIYREDRRLLDLRIFLTASWLPSIGLTTLKLSGLQAEWGMKTWFVLGGFYFMFLASYDLFMTFDGQRAGDADPGEELSEALSARLPRFLKLLYRAAVIVSVLGVLAFLLECVVFRFELPVFSDLSHAYTSFHVTGVHYFVVSLVFVPALTAVLLTEGVTERRERTGLILMNLAAFLIPVLILSKLQILMSVVLPALVFLLRQRRYRKRTIAAGALTVLIFLTAAFTVITMLRKYPEGYLSGIFKFKDPDTSPLVQLPYIYVTNNFENLNLLIVKLRSYAYGARSLTPLFSLTGLKFLPAIRDLLAVEYYFTAPELTTATILYDAYGDLGAAGTYLFGLLLGTGSAAVSALYRRKNNVFSLLMYCQMAQYLLLSFFACWFSNPTTWFYFVVTGAVAVFCTKRKGRFSFSLREGLYGNDLSGRGENGF